MKVLIISIFLITFLFAEDVKINFLKCKNLGIDYVGEENVGAGELEFKIKFKEPITPVGYLRADAQHAVILTIKYRTYKQIELKDLKFTQRGLPFGNTLERTFRIRGSGGIDSFIILTPQTRKKWWWSTPVFAGKYYGEVELNAKDFFAKYHFGNIECETGLEKSEVENN